MKLRVQQTHPAICPISRKVLLCQIKSLVIKIFNVYCGDITTGNVNLLIARRLVL